MSNLEGLTVDCRPTLPEGAEIGIGVIGAGFVAQDYQLPGYQHAGLKVLAVADLKEGVAEDAAARFGIPHAFTDYRRILDMPEVQVVDVLTPRRGRLEVIRDVASAGKHLMSQKPLSTTYAEGRAMVEAAEAAGVRMGVHLHYHWLPAYRAAWRLLRDGVVGEPLVLHHQMIGDQDVAYWNNPVRKWNAFVPDFLLVEWGAHQLDFLRFWAGEAPLAVHARTTRAPDQHFESDLIGVVTVTFEGGVLGSLLMSQVTRGASGCMDFRIEATEGSITAGGFTSLSVSRAGEGVYPVTLLHETDFREVVHMTYVGTMSDMLWALAEDREPASSARDYLASVAMCEAAVRSASEGRSVDIAEVTEG